MPFLGYEKWEEHIYEPFGDVGVDIPCDDLNAYRLNPTLRHYFYKPLLLDLLGEYNAPSGSPVQSYPVIQKPALNPWGMGMGVRIFDTYYDHTSDYVPGHFLMKKHEGIHRSIDCLVLDGNLEFTQTAIGHPSTGQTFNYWELVRDEFLIPDKIRTLISQTKFTGCINIELIGYNLIELTFRHSGQFVDMYDKGFLSNIISLYISKTYTDIEQVSGRFSVPVFVPDVYDERLAPYYGALTVTIDPANSPVGGQRFGYINTSNLHEALELRQEIQNVVNNH